MVPEWSRGGSRDGISKGGEWLERRGWNSVRHRINHDLIGAPVSGATVTYAAPLKWSQCDTLDGYRRHQLLRHCHVMATATSTAGMYNIAATTTNGTTATTLR